MTSLDSNAPERQLWCAVISRAVHDATDRIAAVSELEARRRIRNDARGWVVQNGRDFREACESAGYDPDFLRSRILLIMADDV